MVEFNYDATVGRSGDDIVRINVLARIWNLQEAREEYFKHRVGGVNIGIEVVAARTRSLIEYIYGMLQRRLNEEELKELLRKGRSLEYEELTSAYYDLQKLFDDIMITRLDTQKVYDSTNAEEENIAKGL